MVKTFAWTAWTVALLGLLSAAGPEPAQADPEPAATEKGKNLVPNGDFEEGDLTPKGWQTVDGLSTFYVKDPDSKRGKVIKMDTDVTQDQAYKWWLQIFKGASPKDGPKKIPSLDPNKYDTLAGLDGVWFWSDYFPIEKGKEYWLSIDAKGPGGGMLAWLVGYAEMSKEALTFGGESKSFQEYLKEGLTGKKPDRGRNFENLVNKYHWKGQLSSIAGTSPNEWKTFTRRKMPFRPSHNPVPGAAQVRYCRIMVYAYWPPGEYYVDNVRLVEFDPKLIDKKDK